MTTDDPIRATVLARAFEAICGEMGNAMIRTATSAVFTEGRDFSCALVDPRAQLVAAANYDPSHLAAMPTTAACALLELGLEEIVDGDVILVNDPYRGGGHLTDIALIRPCFADGRLLAFAVNRGHHIDVGGMAVAGFPGTARSVYQEGLRIPPVRWFEGGVERRQVMDLILLNVRFPRAQHGDFLAQLASCVTAERRLRELVDRYGFDVVERAMAGAQDHSERLMRAAIVGIADGTSRFRGLVDDDGVGNGPFAIDVAVTIAGDRAIVDFAGTSRQADGPINSSFSNTIGSCFNAFLFAFGDIPFNDGCFRPIEFRVPRGSFLNPVPPAPVFGGVTDVSIHVIEAVSGALAQVVPERIAAASYGTCLNVAGGGFDDARGEPFGFYFFQEGGWGATAWRDGWTSVPNPTSNFNDYPVEVLESDLPLRVRAVDLNEGSAGAGRFRGGFGTRRTIELLADVEVSALGDRFVIPPFGLSGGTDGRPNRLLVRQAGQSVARTFADAFGTVSPSKFASLPLRAGDRLILETGGGGGYGDPFERDPAAVAADVRDGLVTRGEARDAYGVALGADTLVDGEATAALRSRRSVAVTGVDVDAVPVPPPDDSGAVGAEIAAVARLVARIESGVADDPCRTRCPKAGAAHRCPFHHPYATDFWTADSLERWAARNCLLAGRLSSRR